MSAGAIYLSENSLDQKAYKTVDAITLISDTTVIDSKTHNNVETTVASLTAELFSANKNPMEALRGNVHPENLLGKCRLGGCTSKKMVTGGFLRATHY